LFTGYTRDGGYRPLAHRDGELGCAAHVPPVGHIPLPNDWVIF